MDSVVFDLSAPLVGGIDAEVSLGKLGTDLTALTDPAIEDSLVDKLGLVGEVEVSATLCVLEPELQPT